MPMPRKVDLTRICNHCGTILTRRRFNGRLEDRGVFLRRVYCDRSCMAAAFLTDDPSSTYMARFLKESCETCGATRRLGVHHLDEDRTNNSPANLQTLCPACHTRLHWATGKQPWRRHPPICTVCGEPAKRLGLCETHRSRLLRHGSPYLVKRKIGHTWQLVEDRG